MTMRLSVVVPAHNAASTLRVQLEALLAQECDGPWEIVVVDNGSTDDTASIVQQIGAGRTDDPVVRLVSTVAGAGPSHARNVGIVAAAAPIVACCDADDVVADGWVRSMQAALSAHDFVAGALELDRLNPPWLVAGRGRSIERCPAYHDDLLFPHGCNFGIRRDLFLTNQFDERWRAGEEIELAYRLRAAGIRCTFIPDAVVHYRYREGFVATFRQARIAGRAQRMLRSLTGRGDGRSTIVRRCVWLIARSPRLVTRDGRIRWAWIAGDVVGRIGRRGDITR
jgi:glycosyltransferase involved in cell wall biosynthesis